jgi:hypothetical protein
MELLSKIILSKHQEYFLPVLRQNVLSSNMNKDDTDIEDDDRDWISPSLNQEKAKRNIR